MTKSARHLAPYADEIITSVTSFPASISKLASKLSLRDHGPFPLYHGDFGHNNTIVNDEFKILGLIDWEFAFAAPWELFSDYPLTFSTFPPLMDAPWNHDSDGSPVDPELCRKVQDQVSYLEAIKELECRAHAGNLLSTALANGKLRQIATCMRLYQEGKVGFYSKITDTI